MLSHDSTHAPLLCFSLLCHPYKDRPLLSPGSSGEMFPIPLLTRKGEICSRTPPMCLPPQRSSRTDDLAKRRHTTVNSNGCTARLKYCSHRRKRSLLAPLPGKSSTADNELSRVSAAEISPPLSLGGRKHQLPGWQSRDHEALAYMYVLREASTPPEGRSLLERLLARWMCTYC